MNITELIYIRVQHADFDPGAEINALSLDEGAGLRVGAVASFTGYVRGQEASLAEEITAMTLEHYPGMTEQALADIVQEARARWQVLRVRITHRIGRLMAGERIVFVGVASQHRHEAFAACEFIMDYLKTAAPFWKKETTARGDARWVAARASDDAAKARWQK